MAVRKKKENRAICSLSEREASALIYPLMRFLKDETRTEVTEPTAAAISSPSRWERVVILRGVLKKVIKKTNSRFDYSDLVLCGLVDMVSPALLKGIAGRREESLIRETARHFLLVANRVYISGRV